MTRPPATAAALPPDEPPGVRPCCHGLCVVPCRTVRVTLTPPNSLAVVCPASTAPPSSRMRCSITAVYVGDLVGEHHARVRVRPTLDVVQLLHADRHAAERLADVGGAGFGLGLLAGQVAERVQIARFDGRVGGLQLLDRRPSPRAKLIDQRTGIALPRCVPHAGTVIRGHWPWARARGRAGARSGGRTTLCTRCPRPDPSTLKPVGEYHWLDRGHGGGESLQPLIKGVSGVRLIASSIRSVLRGSDPRPPRKPRRRTKALVGWLLYCCTAVGGTAAAFTVRDTLFPSLGDASRRTLWASPDIDVTTTAAPTSTLPEPLTTLFEEVAVVAPGTAIATSPPTAAAETPSSQQVASQGPAPATSNTSVNHGPGGDGNTPTGTTVPEASSSGPGPGPNSGGGGDDGPDTSTPTPPTGGDSTTTPTTPSTDPPSSNTTDPDSDDHSGKGRGGGGGFGVGGGGGGDVDDTSTSQP